MRFAKGLSIGAVMAALLLPSVGAAWGDGQREASVAEQIAIPLVPIALEPGWNLISIPFQPHDPAIDAISTPGHPADVVMTYDSASEAWAVSQRDPDTGLFAGDISELTPDRAYFVRTDSFLPLLVGRPPLTTWSTPPAAPRRPRGVEGVEPCAGRCAQLPHTRMRLRRTTTFGRFRRAPVRAGWRALGYNPLAQRWEAISPGDVTIAGVGATNPCTGGPVRKERVEAGTEPCQAGAYTERSAVGSTTPGDVWDEFDGSDRVALRAALRMGKGYWVYASADGVILP